MAIQCPKCGSTNPDNARFCWNDGEKLVTTGFQPFRFRSGGVANSLSDLVMQTDAHWEDGKYHLYQGDFANWLGSIGRADLASEARSIVSSERDQDIGLEKFLQRFGLDAPPAPQLQVSPTALDFGTVDGEAIASSNPTRQFRITNAERGHLYGTIQSSDPWLTVGGQFSGNAVTITARATKEGKRATIHIDSNGGKQAVPVKMNPVRPWYRIKWLKYTVAFILIALGDVYPTVAMVTVSATGELYMLFVGIVLPSWGSLIGLGAALLITRTKMTLNDWRGYAKLFISFPIFIALIFVIIYFLGFFLTEIIPGNQDKTLNTGLIILLILGITIASFVFYCRAEAGILRT